MGLAENLISAIQREVAGSRTSARFQYQFRWGLTQLMQIHGSQSDYVIGFEYHDDVVDLDAQDKPACVNFYQIKTRSASQSNWTLDAVSKATKDEPVSIVAKMYQHNIKIIDASRLFSCFVTNKPMSFAVAGKPIFSGDDLDDDSKKKLVERIAVQLSTDASKIDLKKILFHQTDLSLEDVDNHLIGKVHNFFDQQKLGKTKVHSWLSHMLKEIQRCNDYAPDKIKNYDDFLKNKAISKADVQTLLDQISKSENEVYPMFDAVLNPKLIQQNADITFIKKLKKNWETFSSEMVNPANEVLHKLYQKIRIEVKNATEQDLIKMMNSVLTQIKKTEKWDSNIFSDDYVRAMILWGRCEQD